MQEPLDEREEIRRLTEQLREIEQRVTLLEHREPHGGLLSRILAEPEPQPAALAAIAAPVPELQLQAGMFAVAGRAVLGLAGAYLLRALAETNSAPRVLIVIAAILYAAGWLIASVRTREHDELATTTYALTASLILTPLLWEATVKFGTLPASITAVLLVFFAAVAPALAWRRNLAPVAIATTIAAAATALVLMIGTGELLSFALAILAIAVVVEVCACSNRWRTLRPVAALAADFTVWLLIHVHTMEGGVPENYKAIAPVLVIAIAGAMALIYLASLVWRTMKLNASITNFEAVQLAMACGLALTSALLLEPCTAPVPVGVFCVAAALTAYLFAFRKVESDYRDYQVFGAYGLLLGLAGTWLLLPLAALTIVWSTAAIMATASAERRSQWTLATHGAICICAGWFVSGAPDWTVNALMGSAPSLPDPAVLAITVGTGVCYVVWSRMSRRSGLTRKNVADQRWMRWACLVAASFTVIMIAALASSVGGHILSGGHPGPALMATVRMLVTCTTALAAGFAGVRKKRDELVWISYGLIGLGSVKLVLEDFRQNSPAALALSLLCYGAVLVLVPRMRRSGIN